MSKDVLVGLTHIFVPLVIVLFVLFTLGMISLGILIGGLL